MGDDTCYLQVFEVKEIGDLMSLRYFPTKASFIELVHITSVTHSRCSDFRVLTHNHNAKKLILGHVKGL